MAVLWTGFPGGLILPACMACLPPVESGEVIGVLLSLRAGGSQRDSRGVVSRTKNCWAGDRSAEAFMVLIIIKAQPLLAH